MRQTSQKENSSIASNGGVNGNRKSCPNSKSSILSGGSISNGRYSCMSGDSCTDKSSRSSSNNYKADRFIPFRGTQDNFFEEFIMNNDPFNETKKKKRQGSNSRQSNQINGVATDNTNNNSNIVTNTRSTNSNSNNQTTSNTIMADNSNYSSNSSSSPDGIQYSRGSGNKIKQTFQEFITESLFSNNRGSPNTLTIKEAQEEEQLRSKITDDKALALTKQRILSFKEKKDKPTMSLQKNLSLISSIAQEKTHKQKKSLRYIPQVPEKILDAPDLQDDYYLNLLDWSQENILAVCLAQTVYLWNSDSGEIKQLFDTENDDDIVTSVSWMKGSGSVIAIGTQSKQIHLWDTNKFERIRTFEGQHTERVSSLSWNPLHTSLLSSGSLDSFIHNNDVRVPIQQSMICTYKAHRQEVCGLKWSPDGQQLASGGNDNLLCIWDINNRMRGIPQMSHISHSPSVYGPRYCFTDHKAAVKALSWCPWQKNLLASGGGSRDQCIKFWNTDKGSLINSVQTDSQVCALQWNPYEKEILSSHGFINNQLSIWKYPNMKKVADLRGHTSRVLHLALSPDGTTVASAAADETLRFWKVFQPSSSTGVLPMSKSSLGFTNKCPSTDLLMADSNKFFQTPSVFATALR
ncbi:anaphase-promoting complex subunit cdc20-like [Stylonychia lemnae]|uniref:Anaphase-promoting complex subunit cdc20-like n=1 Tax=Stylonychia lemnae TaxID=5949 RepID=A0A078AB19_STYLE|nr:anaphase-promoting complex subunit cdc20-like [Stylonychia lemnae]|eukprot:CDW78802.1 anaphase-promoting complex subunit cdc20-like [Stylonychia lemnae]